MAHETFAREEPVLGSSPRAFGFVFAAVFLIVAAWPLLFGQDVRWWSVLVAVAFIAAAVGAPRLLAPLNALWTRFGLLLHRIVNPVLLGIMFFLVVVPTGLLMRIFGKDVLRLKIDPAVSSYWVEREPPSSTTDSFKEQF
jgi:hypothetical protein